MLPAALIIGVARSLSLVLTDGRVIDTILNGLATPLSNAPAAVAALLMIPFHAIIHVAVPSVSGQAVLTMPVLVPLSDLLGIPRDATVFAYQTGAGLTEMLTPTNGGLMAVLLAAGVPYGRWIRFAIVGVLLALMIGVAAMISVLSAAVGRVLLDPPDQRGAFERLIRFANWRYAPGTPAGSCRNHEHAV